MNTEENQLEESIPVTIVNESNPSYIKQSWEEIDAIYQAIAEGVLDSAVNLEVAVKLLTERGCKEVETMRVAVILKDDLETIVSELQAAHELHVGKTGTIEDDEAQQLCFLLYDMYTAIGSKFTTLILPTMITITEYLQEAKDNLMQLEDGPVEVLEELDGDEDLNDLDLPDAVPAEAIRDE